MKIYKNSKDSNSSNSKVLTKGFHSANLLKEPIIEIKFEDIKNLDLGVNLLKEPIVEVKTIIFPKWVKPFVLFFIFLKEKL